MNHILVVEDEAQLREDICDILDLEGYTTSEAGNGVEAWDTLQNKRPDLILCDVVMPRMGGIEFVKKLRANDTFATIPFVFLSARVTNDDVETGLNAGANKYLSKPFNSVDLLALIEELLQK